MPSIVVSEPGGQLTPYRTNESALRLLLVAYPRRLGFALESQVGRPGGLIVDKLDIDFGDVASHANILVLFLLLISISCGSA